jgi:hypothetical protein
MAKKEGLTWIAERTNQFRYASGGQDRWLQPQSRYKAAKAIKRGQLISIALPEDAVSLDGDNDSAVVPTNTKWHTKIVGIAGAPAAVGEWVSVQAWGKFTFDLTADPANEFWPSEVDDDSRGKLLYAGPEEGGMTHDEIEAVLDTRNLITIGYVSNTAETIAPAISSFDIEIQLEADGRGPLGTTQFEYELGEDFSYKSKSSLIFAVGKSSAKTFEATIRIRQPESGGWPTNGWIAMYSPREATILSFGVLSATGDSLIQLQRIQNFSHNNTVVDLFGGGGTPPASWMDPVTQGDSGSFEIYDPSDTTTRIGNSIINALDAPANEYFLGEGANPLGVSNSIQADVDGDHQWVDLTISHSLPAGPLYFEVSPELATVFDVTYTSIGSYDVRGKVVLADNRFPERNQALGVFLNRPQVDLFEAGSKVLLLRQGTYYNTTGNYDPGEVYYLGYYGRLLEQGSQVIYPEKSVEIGFAKAADTLIVDVESPAVPRGNDYPVGTIKSLPDSILTAEEGWLLMDGVSVHAQADYPELYDQLVAAYGEVNIISGTTDFIIPAFENAILNNFYQIKAIPFGYQPDTPIMFNKKFEGTLSSGAVADTLDVSYMARTGLIGDFELPHLKNLIIKFEVEVAPGDWREIQPYYDGTNGFEWVITDGG